MHSKMLVGRAVELQRYPLRGETSSAELTLFQNSMLMGWAIVCGVVRGAVWRVVWRVMCVRRARRSVGDVMCAGCDAPL